ncbi:hypothetical protein BH20ACI2_BH20ACI2_08630 [soil metagenome]
MNRNIFTSFFVVLLLAASSVTVLAQASRSAVGDKYIISARAGGVNYVHGPVAIARVDGSGGSLLRGDRLEIGDRVSTATAARTEVLLNPGSYMRVGGNSEFHFVTTALDDLQIRLNKGSAIFEVFATDDFRVSVITPKGNVSMIESGVYRVDVRPGGNATVAVTEGKAQLGDNKATIVKSGRVGTVGSSIAIAKFDRGNRDEMDEWSRSRAKDLAKVTSSLKQKDIRDSLISSFNNDRWGMYDSFGLWIYNPNFGAYSFLPFGNRWNSPYGYGFGWGMDWQTIPWWTRVPAYVHYGTAGGTAGQVKERRRGAIVAPPYTEVERQSQSQTGVNNIQDVGSGQRSVRGRAADSGVTPAVQAPVQRSEPEARPSRKSSPID